MQFSSVSTHLCRPKNVIKIGSLFLSDLRAVAHEKLSNNFQHVEIPKQPIRVSDPAFYGKSIQEQHKLVMDKLPENIRDEVELETLADGVDNMLRHVQLKKDFIVDSNIDPVTPQMHLDAAVMHFKNGDGDEASKSAWLAADLQLKNLLLNFYLCDAGDHGVKNRIVYFLEQQCCNDSELAYKFYMAWISVELAYYNTYNEVLTMKNIWESITSSEEFCNIIVSIYEKGYFNGFDLLKWMVNDEVYLKKMIVKYDNANPNLQAKKLFYFKKILMMSKSDLIKFIEKIPAKLQEDGADVDILNFLLDQSKEMLNVFKKKI